MYNPTQNGTAYHDYPYDPRTHTFASPGGFHYPAPSAQYTLQLAHVTNGHFYQQEVGPHTSNGVGHGHGFDPNFQRYGPGDWEPDPRAALGISTLGHSDLSSHQLPYRPPHTSYHLPDHRLESPAAPHRAVTLDSSSTRHHGPTPPFSRSPIHSQSANQTRTASPLSSRSSQRRPPHAGWNETPRPRPRVGGPPKAPLGGIGGKPWDERRTNDRSVSTPLPTSDSHTPLKTRQAILGGEEPEPTFKGSPIVFKPPPATYSPEDSPETPMAELTIEGREESLEGNSVRVSRKEAFPWPVQPPRGPAVAIPLPPSPVEPDPEKGGRRTWTSIASTAIMESPDGALIKGKRKEVVLAVPNEAEWKSSMTALSSAKKQQLWEAVYLRRNPPAPEIFASQDTPAVTNDEQEATQTERTSTPPPQEALGDILGVHRSPPTPTRRGQSNTPSAGSAFVRRQLGGMLRSSPSSRSARTRTSTTSIPESSEGTVGAGAEDQIGCGGSRSDSQGVDESRTQDGKAFSGEKENVNLEGRRQTSIDKIPAHPVSEQSFTGPSQEPPTKSIDRDDEDAVRPAKRTQDQEHMRDERRDDEETTRPSTMREHSDTESTTPSAKKLRPTAQAWEPRSRTSSSTSNADIRPVPRLRPTAHAFTPSFSRVPSANSYVPTGAGQFTFQSNSGSITDFNSDSRAQSIDAGSHQTENPSAIDTSPSGQDQLQGSDDQNEGELGGSPDYRLLEDDDIRNDHTAGVSSLSELPDNMASSQETRSSRDAERESSGETFDTDTDNELDLPTARPFSLHGVEERFAVHQDQQPVPAPATVHNSPAAELHGMFAESPNASISDSGLFYRRPRSEVSDAVEVLSDSFDPVSYSYESDSESTYEVSSTAVFLTSTPRGGHHVLPIGSTSSMSDRSDGHQDDEAPAVTYPDPDPRRRFIEWTFPATNGHRPMPSIYRRHTFDHLASDHNDEDLSASPQPGIASTFASRVGDLRAHLALAQAQNSDQSEKKEHLRVLSGPSGMLSTKSSAEFPMRSPSRILAVINDTPGDRTSGDMPPQDTVGAEEEGDRDPVLAASRAGLVDVAEITRLLSGISNQLDRTIEAIESSSQGSKVDISPLANKLEQQSALISSLANATQQNKGHQNDHLVPLLEGQQAVLDKLSTLQSAQPEITGVLARVEQHQSDVVGDLRSELAQMVVKKQEQMEEVHRLEVELLETRQAQFNAENGGMETRRSFEAALSRITTLQSDLQVVQEEKQSLSGEVQSLTIAQQRRASMSKKQQVELETKQADLVAEKRRNETLAETIRLQSSELAELRRSTFKFQDTLVDRLSRIEEGVQQSTVGSADYVVLQKQNQRLQGEIDGLKEIRHTAKQENHIHQPRSTMGSRELDALRRELDMERGLRQKATERAEAADKALEQEVTTRLHAQAMAQERVRYAHTQEAQLQARTKECQRWQTLALTPDRNAYRNYMKLKPRSVNLTSGTSTPRVKIKSTETSPEQEDLQTPVVSGSGETPTRVWKGKLGQKITARGDKAWTGSGSGRVVE